MKKKKTKAKNTYGKNALSFFFEIIRNLGRKWKINLKIEKLPEIAKITRVIYRWKIYT